jgi:hypothetical protein
MRAEAVIAFIWLAVFIVGVVVGVIGVIALSTMRKDGNDQPGPEDPDEDRWPERDHGVSGIPGRWAGDRGRRPHWPEEPDTRGDQERS